MLKKCPDCKKEVASNALKCPNCGHLFRDNIDKFIAIIIVVVVIISSIIIAYNKNNELNKVTQQAKQVNQQLNEN